MTHFTTLLSEDEVNVGYAAQGDWSEGWYRQTGINDCHYNSHVHYPKHTTAKIGKLLDFLKHMGQAPQRFYNSGIRLHHLSN